MDYVTGTAAMMCQQFDAHHGASGPGINIGGWLTFPDGARREASGYGALMDPPAKLYDRLCVQEQYHRALFQRALKRLDTLKRELITNYAHVPESQRAGNVQRLKDLRDEVRKHRNNLLTIQTEMKNHDPRPWKRPKTEAQIIADNTARAKLEDYRQALLQVEI